MHIRRFSPDCCGHACRPWHSNTGCECFDTGIGVPEFDQRLPQRGIGDVPDERVGVRGLGPDGLEQPRRAFRRLTLGARVQPREQERLGLADAECRRPAVRRARRMLIPRRPPGIAERTPEFGRGGIFGDGLLQQ